MSVIVPFGICVSQSNTVLLPSCVGVCFFGFLVTHRNRLSSYLECVYETALSGIYFMTKEKVIQDTRSPVCEEKYFTSLLTAPQLTCRHPLTDR